MVVPLKKVGTVQKTMKQMATMGAERSSQGRNLPFLLCFFAKTLSIKAPISGSLTASQTFQTSSRVASTTVLTCRTLV